MEKRKSVIAVIGLGYVGLPLAVAFSRKYEVIGFDTDKKRIAELIKNNDSTKEIDEHTLQVCQAKKSNSSPSLGLFLTADTTLIKRANVFIIAVPTPIDSYNTPNLRPLLHATSIVGKMLKKDDVVIYESTVYPGCTEEECIPLLEKESSLQYNKDFFCGYSPERINPGDKEHVFRNIKKITSGSNAATADFVDCLYQSVLENGTFKAPTIKVAEMAKVVENSQRDLNISFVNEIALICDRLNIDTNDVIDAAATKWNFVVYRPGLVGGHCIAVDPYYLVHKALQVGYEPKVLQSGRWVNNYIAKFIAHKTIKALVHHNFKIRNAPILILGITFKENCPDCRNTQIPHIINELKDFGCKVDVFDPLADKKIVKTKYNISILSSVPNNKKYSAIIICVKHSLFQTFDFASHKIKNGIIFDIKNCIDRNIVDYRL